MSRHPGGSVVERHVVIPVTPDALWDALTQPEQLGAWFGYQVEWELTPGGSARWTRPDSEDTRCGIIDDVAPGQRLSYRWWPETGNGPASTVTYDLEQPDDDSGVATRLTVRESVIDRPEEAGDGPVACASIGGHLGDRGGDDLAVEGWSPWDIRHAALWLHMQTALVRLTV